MTTLILTFPGRRYHATPWGHHVNEGLIEWPPSPWRLLRALLGVGYAHGLWGPEGPGPMARSLFNRLAGKLPAFRLPRATGAHTRHYMPLARIKDGREETTLVFDTWAQIDDGILAVFWDVDLPAGEKDILALLTERMGYLGRAESWVEARLAEEGEAVPSVNCQPGDRPTGPGWEQVSVLAPLPGEEAYAEWRREMSANSLPNQAPAEQSAREGRKTKVIREKAMMPYPIDLMDAMQKDTSWLQGFGWSQPPGSRRVFYWRRAEGFNGVIAAERKPIPLQAVKAVLLSLSTRAGNRHELPPVVFSLVQGERLHKALVSIAGEYNLSLSGCDEWGRPLCLGHDHAHFLPLDLDGDGHIDHFLLWSPMGLDEKAQRAVRTIRKTFAKNVKSLHLALAATCAELGEWAALPGLEGEALSRLLGGAIGSRDWVSCTPFVPPRHMKRQGKNSLKGQIEAELESRGFPEPEGLEIVDPRQEQEYLRHRHFTRVRKQGPPPPVDCGFTVRLRFPRTVHGPLVLGYGSHYGLGIFVSTSK